MNPTPLYRPGFAFLRLIFLLGLSVGGLALRGQAEVVSSPIVFLEDTLTITIDPVIQQEVLTLRLAEAVVPPPPSSFEVVGFNTELASLLVQRSEMGRGWYELRIEEEVLAALLELHGLAPDQRSRMLRWERSEVRAGCYRRLLAILNKTNRTAAEQRVFDATTAAVKTLHVGATEESLRLYNQWNFAPNLFVPPPPFTYSRPPPANHGLFHLFGGPKPPSFDEFKQYGVAVVFAGAGGNGEFQRIIKATATRAAIVGAAVLTSGVVGGVAGAALAAALPSALAILVVRTVAPFAVRATFTAAAAGASAAVGIGASVVGAVVGVVVTSVFEGSAVVDAAQVPGKLAEAVNNARNMSVDLSAKLTTEAGIAEIYTAFLKTTLPDFPATEQAPAALATDQQWLTAPAGSSQFRPAPTLQMQDPGGLPISVRLLEGWFVVRDQAGKEIMTLNLEYLGTEGQPQTLTKLANGFFCTDATGNLGGCARVSGFSFRNWNNQPRLAKLGSGGVQAVINPSALTDGAVGVLFAQNLAVTSPGTGAYSYSHITEGPGLPPGLSLSSTGTLSGTPLSAGTFVFEVYATNPGGTHPAAQRLTVRIEGNPVPAPANLLSSWLFEDNSLDTAGTAHGSWNGTAAYSSGWIGKAASFTGSNSIELPQNIFPAGAKSFETWFRTTGAGVILGQIGVNSGYVPAIYVDTNGKLRVSFFWSGTLAPVTSAASVNNGQWQHVAVTHDGATQRVYLNGALISSVNYTQVSYATGYRYLLGYGNTAGWPAVNNGYFTGDIDEAALYGRALGAEEVAGLYTAGGAGKLTLTPGNVAPAGAVGTWLRGILTVQRNGSPLSNISSLRVVGGALPHGLILNPADLSISGTPRSVGTFTFTLRATDATGHSGERAYSMTINGPWRPRPDGLLDWWPGEGDLTDRMPPARPLVWSNPGGLSYSPGLTGQGFSNSTYARMPVFPNIGISGITVETWFQTNRECVIMARRPSGGGTHSPVLWVGRDGFVRGDFSRPASAALSKPLTGTGRVDDGGWHHVALSFGPGEQRLHVDGVLVGMGRGLGVNSEVFGGNFTLGGSEPFLPGWPGLPDGSFPDPYLSVSNFDEPALYGRVLETSEINGIFASGSRGKPTLLVNEATLPAVSSGIPYRQALSVQGATGVLTWSITSGSLPGGLSLSSSGIISGMLARIRSSAVSIQVTDNTGAVGVRDYVIAAQGTPAPVPFGAVAWWRGDLNPNDSSGSRHGVPTFSGPTYRSGNSGNAFFFNREGSSLALPAGSFPSVDTLFGSRTPYSFETWFLTDRPGVILGRRDFGYPLLPAVFKPALYVGTDGLLRAPMFEVDRTAGAPVSSQRVDDGKFHHAAVTYDGSTLRLYLDGVLQGPLVTNATSRFGSLVDTVELGSGYTGSLGFNWPATQGGWMGFYGYIDEPSTYNRALNEGEIRAINQAGEMGKANAPVINVTLPAGRIAESYLTAAFSGQGALVVFGSGGMPPGLQISPEGIVSGIPESAGLHQFKCGVRQSNGTWLTFQYSLSITGTAASPVGMAGWYSGEGTTLGHLPGETAISPNGINYALGQVGQAFSFDGVSQHLIVSNVPFPAPGGEWSFETWFRSAAGGVILGQSAPTGGYIPMLYINAEGRLHAEAYNSGSTVSQMQSTTRVDDGFYHHAVITYANGQRRLYLDGTLVDSRNVPGVPYAPAYDYQIGSGIITGWPLAPANRFFTGQIDEPQFYHRALDPSEARRGYTAGKLGRSAIVLDNTLTDITAATGPYAGQITATGGAGLYTFAVTEGRLPVGLSLSPQGQLTGAVTHSSGTFDFAIEATSSSGAKSIRDYQIIVHPNARYRPAGVKAWWSANGNPDDWTGNHAASAFSNVAGQPFAYGEGITGQGFAFRGLGMMSYPFGLPFLNEGVVLPNSAFPAPGQRGPFSLELWFRATRPGGLLGQSNQPILGNYSLPMLYIDTAGYLRTQIGWTAAPNQVVSPGIVLDNTWHHLASTLDAAGLMQVYLDGTLIGTRSGIGPVLENPRVTFFLGHVSANGWPLSGDSFTGVTFTGQIDEVSTWSRVLTQEEILRLLACGPNGKANLTITPGGHLPAAVRHVAFTQALTVSGQTNPRFTLVSGSLPPGISLSTSGSVNPPVSGLFGTPSSTGYWELLLRNIPPAGPPATTELVDEHFTFNADPSAAYREWANAEGGLQGPARQPLASPFADSANLLKFGFNLHPTTSDQRILAGENAGLPSVTRDPAGRLVLEFIRRRAITPPHLSYEITTGSDLDTLTPLSLNNALITPIDATWERVLVTDPILTPRRFGRVLVNQN